ISWDQLEANPSGFIYGEKTHGHFRAQVQTPDGRIVAAPESFVAVLRDRLAEPAPVPDAAFPLQLVNQRHFTMMNSWLVEAVKRNVRRGDIVEINPVDASARTIEDGQRVTVRSDTGLLQAMARVTTDVPEGIVSMDHGWGSRLFDPVGGAPPEVQGVNRNQLVSAHMLDELSGTPNLNGTPVEVEGRAG
ncbi:MAG: formate dehydrogenase, partial [Sphingomonadales bacterium]